MIEIDPVAFARAQEEVMARTTNSSTAGEMQGLIRAWPGAGNPRMPAWKVAAEPFLSFLPGTTDEALLKPMIVKLYQRSASEPSGGDPPAGRGRAEGEGAEVTSEQTSAGVAPCPERRQLWTGCNCARSGGARTCRARVPTDPYRSAVPAETMSSSAPTGLPGNPSKTPAIGPHGVELYIVRFCT